MKNSPLSTSLRSATHATDSTRKGWIAKTAATKALRQSAAVIWRRTRKSKNGRGGVKQDVGEMMSARVQTVKLTVQHMGKPGQGMPVVGMGLGECPDDSFERQASGDLSVLEDILAVIKIDELVPKRLAEDQPGDRGKKEADPEDHPTIVQTGGLVSWLGRGEAAAMSLRCCHPSAVFFDLRLIRLP